MFSARLGVLLDEYPAVSMPQVTLMKAGRHFRSSTGQWIIIPRDDLENRRLYNLRHALVAVLEATEVGGPQGGVLAAAPALDETLREAAALVARYGQGRERASIDVRVYAPDESWEYVVQASPAEGAALAELLDAIGGEKVPV